MKRVLISLSSSPFRCGAVGYGTAGQVHGTVYGAALETLAVRSWVGPRIGR